MEKKLEDYLNFYLGCKVLDVNHNTTLTLIGVEGILYCCKDLEKSLTERWNYSANNIKPILRPLTYSLFIKYGFAFFDKPTWMQEVNAWSECVNKMRKEFIDCDGLIEAGLALDATTTTIERSTATND